MQLNLAPIFIESVFLTAAIMNIDKILIKLNE